MSFVVLCMPIVALFLSLHVFTVCYQVHVAMLEIVKPISLYVDNVSITLQHFVKFILRFLSFLKYGSYTDKALMFLKYTIKLLQTFVRVSMYFSYQEYATSSINNIIWLYHQAMDWALAFIDTMATLEVALSSIVTTPWIARAIVLALYTCILRLFFQACCATLRFILRFLHMTAGILKLPIRLLEALYALVF